MTQKVRQLALSTEGCLLEGGALLLSIIELLPNRGFPPGGWPSVIEQQNFYIRLIAVTSMQNSSRRRNTATFEVKPHGHTT